MFNLCRNISYEKSGENSGIVVTQIEHKMSQFDDVTIGAGTAYPTTADVWYIVLVKHSSVWRIVSKWTIRLIIRSSVRGITSKWTIRLITDPV
jgi:hypothetical protein